MVCGTFFHEVMVLKEKQWIRRLLIFLGTFGGIGTVAFLGLQCDLPMLAASFGSSAVLVYGVPDSPLAQLKNVLQPIQYKLH